MCGKKLFSEEKSVFMYPWSKEKMQSAPIRLARAITTQSQSDSSISQPLFCKIRRCIARTFLIDSYSVEKVR
jgi:hypothetical protein